MKDLSPLVLGLPVVRLSIWDPLPVEGGAIRLDAALEAPGPGVAEAIRRLVAARASGV